MHTVRMENFQERGEGVHLTKRRVKVHGCKG